MEEKMLQRYIEGYSSQQEKESVAKWILDSEENKQHYLLLRRLYDAVLMSDLDITQPERPKIRLISRRVIYEAVKIAAVFLLSFGAYQFLLPEVGRQELPIAMQTLHTPDGQRAEITLADGTRVWLNANTTLTFPTHFAGSERRIELDGEAYFDVTHNEAMKFIVKTEQYQVDVLGTEFNVKAYRQNHRFEASLVRGSVEIASIETGETVRLLPNQRARSENGHLAVATLPHHDYFLWKEGIIVFEHQTMREIFDELQLYYDVNIEVTNNKIHDMPFTGKFRTKDGVEQVLKVLKLRHPFEYRKDDVSNTIYIY